MERSYGLITLLGSGETSLAGGRIFEFIARQIQPPLRIAALETPAGFELNSPRVAGRVTEFLQSRLQNYSPQVEIVPARKRGTDFSPDDPRVLAPLARANLIFMGPGSPTYAVRQLHSSLAWDMLRGRQRRGAALFFASAAAIAVGRWCLPVYEIYKVGQDVFALKGLDLFGDFGLKLSFIPHWNNTDGGAGLDTSRCFVGEGRFREWFGQLPPGETVIGLDEQTGLTFDFQAGACLVHGGGCVHLLQDDRFESYSAGMELPISRFGQVILPDNLDEEIVPFDSGANIGDELPDQEILELLAARERARRLQDWNSSDRMRAELARLGWQVQDRSGGGAIIKKLDFKRDKV